MFGLTRTRSRRKKYGSKEIKIACTLPAPEQQRKQTPCVLLHLPCAHHLPRDAILSSSKSNLHLFFSPHSFLLYSAAIFPPLAAATDRFSIHVICHTCTYIRKIFIVYTIHFINTTLKYKYICTHNRLYDVIYTLKLSSEIYMLWKM
jgi:hypothetical protein